MQPATYQHPHPNPDIATLVEAMKANLLTLSDQIGASKPNLEKDISLGELRGITNDEYQALYGIAKKLCDEGEFQHALPIALQLVANHGRDGRFAFLAGTCLQRIGHSDIAASMYGLCLLMSGDDAAALYRLGECFAALGKTAEAIDAFEGAFELARENEAQRDLQDLASRQLAALRAVR